MGRRQWSIQQAFWSKLITKHGENSTNHSPRLWGKLFDQTTFCVLAHYWFHHIIFLLSLGIYWLHHSPRWKQQLLQHTPYPMKIALFLKTRKNQKLPLILQSNEMERSRLHLDSGGVLTIEAFLFLLTLHRASQHSLPSMCLLSCSYRECTVNFIAPDIFFSLHSVMQTNLANYHNKTWFQSQIIDQHIHTKSTHSKNCLKKEK